MCIRDRSENNPTPTLTQVGDVLEVKWSAPIRGVSDPSSYQVGLFKSSDQSQWQHVTTSSVSGAHRSKSFSSGLEGGTYYMARLVTFNETGSSWTVMSWDSNSDGYLDTYKPAFDEGWGGRTNVLQYTYQGGGNDQKEVQFDRSVPAHQATVNVTNTVGQKIILYYTGDVLSATAETYRVTLTNIESGQDLLLVSGQDFVIDSAADAHQITIARTFSGKALGLTIIPVKVRSADNAVITFDNVLIQYQIG